MDPAVEARARKDRQEGIVSTSASEELREMLKCGRIRSIDDVADYAALAARYVLEEKVEPKVSAELRKWGELLYSAVNRPASDGRGGTHALIAIIQADEQRRLEEKPQRKVLDVAEVQKVAVPSDEHPL